MTSIFLMAKFFCVFFLFKQTFLKKKNLHAKFIFCVHNVVLDILILDFFSFSLHNFFQKRFKLLFLLCDTSFCKPRSMSCNLKIQILEIIVFENCCQNLKVHYFRYIICVGQT